MKSWKKVIAASLLALVIGGIAQAKTTESVPVGKGYDPYPGFIIADMSMEMVLYLMTQLIPCGIFIILA